MIGLFQVNDLIKKRKKQELCELIKTNNYEYCDYLFNILIYLNDKDLFIKYNLPLVLGSQEFLQKMLSHYQTYKYDLYQRSCWHYLAWSGNFEVLYKAITKFKLDQDTSLTKPCIYGGCLHKADSIWYYLAWSGNFSALCKAIDIFKIDHRQSMDIDGNTLWHALTWSASPKTIYQAIDKFKLYPSQIRNNNNKNIWHHLRANPKYKTTAQFFIQTSELSNKINHFKAILPGKLTFTDGCTLLMPFADLFKSNDKDSALIEIKKQLSITILTLGRECCQNKFIQGITIPKVIWQQIAAFCLPASYNANIPQLQYAKIVCDFLHKDCEIITAFICQKTIKSLKKPVNANQASIQASAACKQKPTKQAGSCPPKIAKKNNCVLM